MKVKYNEKQTRDLMDFAFYVADEDTAAMIARKMRDYLTNHAIHTHYPSMMGPYCTVCKIDMRVQ